jgi:dockerin type I repeat protein
MRTGTRLVLGVALLAVLSGSLLAAPSFDIRKPPVQPDPSWTGPMVDPHARQGQWFVDMQTEIEEVRTHEFYDNVEMFGGGMSQHLAIEGHVDPASVVYGAAGGPSAGNIIAFNVMVTVTNDTPGDWEWLEGDNSHDEWLDMPDEQYEGTLYDAKITAEFSVSSLMGGPPLGLYPPYRHTDPNIVAENHQQLGWYCWAFDHPEPDKQQNPGAYQVPTWDLGDIPPGHSATVVMMFSVSGNGLDPTSVGDLRGWVVEDSVQNGTDVLSNRTTSLKISTWVDDLYSDVGNPYLHDVDPGLPLRSSDCSVFHNAVGVGGLSLDIRKPVFGGEVQPTPSYTGPQGIDDHAEQGQWFFDLASGNTEVRTHEFYDPVHELPDGSYVDGSTAITGVVDQASILWSGAPYASDILGFEIDATVTNNTPWPYEWADGSNSHNEALSTRQQYEGTLWQAKLTADFAIDPGILPSGNYPYRDLAPHIVGNNHTQLAYYCWTEGNPDSEKQEFGTFQVPTWDLGDIAQGQSTTVRMKFSVDGPGINNTDPRYFVITQGQDVFLNRETSLKVSTWVDDIALDTGQPFPQEPPLRSSDVSVFHNAEPPVLAFGLSLDIRKPPFNGPVLPLPSWTGPWVDPHALKGQWFMGLDGIETVRTHEYHDPVPGDEQPLGDIIPLQLPNPLPAGGAIYGFCKNVVYGAASPNIVSFDIEATITNLTPYDDEWINGDNSHQEWSEAWWQYEGPLLETKLTAEFAIDAIVGPPPLGVLYPPYRDIAPRPNIVAANHDQLAWYCWTPENPEELQPFGNFSVPTWDFGDIQQGQSVTVTLKFTVDSGGLSAADPRRAVIVNSDANHTDVLSNRTTSLKVSTWVDELAADPGTPYPHMSSADGTPLRSSDCSVFHNVAEEEPIGGLSLPVTKPPLVPVPSWTGPTLDPDAISGQWFRDHLYGLEDWRTHELHDNVSDNNPYFRSMGSGAIYGRVTNVVQDPTNNNILSFDVEAFVTNNTPFPETWIEGTNSHEEGTDPRTQYVGVLYDTKLAIEFAINLGGPLPPADISPYRFGPVSLIRAMNNDQLAWYCWTPDNPEPVLVPWGDYHVPTWDFGDILQGGTAHRTLQFAVGAPGLAPGDARYQVIINSRDFGDDILLNRSTSLKISTWIDDLVRDWGVPYPHDDDLPPLRSSNCSVFHDTVRRLRIVGVLDFDWVYVNTPVTTQWRHESICTVTAVREAAPGELYTVAVQENGVTPMTNFVLGLTSQVGNVVTVEIDGGLLSTSVPSPAGGPPYTITVILAGGVSGQSDACNVLLTLRQLGDVNGDATVDTSDKLEINRELNGIATTATLRELDLTGDGTVDTNDKLQVNRVLNGIAVP